MKTIKTIFRKKDLRNRLIFTIVILFLIQAAAGIPTPGVDPDYFESLIAENSGLSLFSLLAGSGLGNLSITMLSVTPYITASIILQLMGVIFPSLQEMQRDGETGQKKFKRITILLGAVMALVESLGFAIGFGRQGVLISYKWYWVLCVTVIWTVAAIIITLLGELIEKKGIGQGISLILMCNILSGYPSDMQTLYSKFLAGKSIGDMVINGTVILALLICLFAFTILVQTVEKRIPITYSRKVQGRTPSDSYFPIKLCPGTVVPVIFASSLMSMPTLIASLAGKGTNLWVIKMLNSSNWFDKENITYSVGVIIYIALIFGFSYYYSNLVLNPLEVANNLKKSSGMIPGVRPGKPTADYLSKQMKFTIGIGACAMCLIALVPCVISGLFGLSSLAFTGTSIIITVGVLLDTKERIMSEIQIDLRYKANRSVQYF